MATLKETQNREKIMRSNELQSGPVADYYAANEDRIVNDMKFDRGLPSALEGDFEGVAIKRNQIENAKYDPEIVFGQPGTPCRRVICRNDRIDNAVLLP